MENCAQAFDKPLHSPEHQDLRNTAWMGGEPISVRYWLGRLLRRNLFREADDAVKQALQDYFAATGCEKGSRLVSDYQSWRTLATLLQHEVECGEGGRSTMNPRLVAAIRGIMANPEHSDAQLAAFANTTEKQIGRMCDVFLLRKLWSLQKSN